MFINHVWTKTMRFSRIIQYRIGKSHSVKYRTKDIRKYDWITDDREYWPMRII